MFNVIRIAGSTKHTINAAIPSGMDLVRYPSDAAGTNHDDWHAKFQAIAGE